MFKKKKSEKKFASVSEVKMMFFSREGNVLATLALLFPLPSIKYSFIQFADKSIAQALAGKAEGRMGL